MKYLFAVALMGSALVGVGARDVAFRAGPELDWNPQTAATYLDARLEWWLSWPSARRDHGTSCVSCHTALPYALVRPSLRNVLGERTRPAGEELMLQYVTTRVRLWREVEPFYPDQTRGLPKTSESRGTEAVLNAAILATRDAEAGALSDDGRLAFTNLWALQMKTGALEGAWLWLNFRLEPWEASASPYFGASLAAIAVGIAPNDYAATPEIQPQLTLLRDYLRRGAESESLFTRLMILWASGELSDVLQASQREAIIAAAEAEQGSDGGWSLPALASWQRIDESVLEERSDGFATAITLLAMQRAGVSPSTRSFSRGRAWLLDNQDPTTGAWPASSVNKQRDPNSDAGRFMSDAATAYAALVLAAESGDPIPSRQR